MAKESIPNELKEIKNKGDIKSIEKNTRNIDIKKIEEEVKQKIKSISEEVKNALKNPPENFLLENNGSIGELKEKTKPIDEEIEEIGEKAKTKKSRFFSKVALFFGVMAALGQGLSAEKNKNIEKDDLGGATPDLDESKHFKLDSIKKDSILKEAYVIPSNEDQNGNEEDENETEGDPPQKINKDTNSLHLSPGTGSPTPEKQDLALNESGNTGDSLSSSNLKEGLDYSSMSKDELRNIWENKKWDETEPYTSWYYKLSENERGAFKNFGLIGAEDWQNVTNPLDFLTKLLLNNTLGEKNKQSLLELTKNFVQFYNQRVDPKVMTQDEINYRKDLSQKLKSGEESEFTNLVKLAEKRTKVSSAEFTEKQKELYYYLIDRYLGLSGDIQYLVPSSYRPTEGVNAESEFVDFNNEIRQEILNSSNVDFEDLCKHPDKIFKLGENAKYKAFSLFRNKKAGSKMDENGNWYISYYLEHGLSPTKLKKVIDLDESNFPFKIYGRFYKEDFKNLKK